MLLVLFWEASMWHSAQPGNAKKRKSFFCLRGVSLVKSPADLRHEDRTGRGQDRTEELSAPNMLVLRAFERSALHAIFVAAPPPVIQTVLSSGFPWHVLYPSTQVRLALGGARQIGRCGRK